MLESDFRGPHVVQNNVGHTLHLVVTGHRDHGNRERKSPRRVDCDQAVDGALQEEPGIFIKSGRRGGVAYDKIKSKPSCRR